MSMMRSRSNPRGKVNSISPRVIAMFLVGTGLIIMAFVVLQLLLKQGEESFSKGSSSASAIPVKVEFPAPELNLQDLQGQAVSLNDYRGQVVLVNNWATWCPPCKAEMPIFQAYFDAHRYQGFIIIAIEAGDPLSEVSAFATSYGISFPVWVDPKQDALIAFRNFSLPNSYVVDRNGQVRLAWTGAISSEMLEGYVTPLLEED